MVVLVQHPQTQSLNNTTVRSILDVNELAPFCAGWQTLHCFESHLIVAWHRPEIVSESRGAKK